MRVAKWGNSLAVRLPAAVVEALGLKPGDNIDIHVAGAHTFAVEKAAGTPRDRFCTVVNAPCPARKPCPRTPPQAKRVIRVSLSVSAPQ